MIPKPLDQIAKQDIDDLVANERQENKVLEYKEDLPGNTDADKKEFLADVSAFANASGGDLIYGVVEKRDAQGKPTGIPQEARGVKVPNTDAEERRLDQMIRDGIEPRIPGVQIKCRPGFTNGSVVVIRIPRSWCSPHMVAKGESRFFSRTNNGKYPLDVGEIRSAFLQSEALSDKIKAFRADRIAKIVADETPVPLRPGPKLVVHIIPLPTFGQTGQVDLATLSQKTEKLAPIYASGSGWEPRFNLDGFLVYSKETPPVCWGYVQVRRDGVIEIADTTTVNLPRTGHHLDGKKVILSLFLENELFKALERILKAVKDEIAPPLYISVALVGVDGFAVISGNYMSANTFDRDLVDLPPVMIEALPDAADRFLKPVLDALWQASGWERCFHYKDNGEWEGKRA